LTFDDGPTAEYTDEVLDLLRAQEVTATFYLTGRECEENPAMLRAIIEAGHELGNHTYSHRRMIFLSSSQLASEIERTDAIFEAAGYQNQTTFRPPGCKRLLTTPLYLANQDRTTVTWDLEPDSGEFSASAEGMVREVSREVRPGSIVLMHLMYDSRAPSRVALPQMIDQLRGQGYRFVTVSELLASGS
ncbi:MAG TPA: polysaccharide deacetylase family protein, partial [Coriobacteriia bacterium]|nr:polysaccharide deacetylase family protein [Coriobacteriia bacterium]